jgi:hypothetical protein
MADFAGARVRDNAVYCSPACNQTRLPHVDTHSHVFTCLTGSATASVSDTRCLLMCCVSPLLLCVGRRCSERGTCVSPVLLVHADSNAGLHRFHCNGVCVVVQLCSQIYGVPQSTSSLRSCLTGVQLHRLTVFLSAVWFPCPCACCELGLCCCVLAMCCSGVGKVCFLCS